MSAEPSELQLSLQKCRGAFWYAALFSLCINLLTVLFSVYSMQVLDRVFSSHSYETLLMLTVLMVAAVLFLGFFSAIRSLILDRTGAWLDQTLSPLLLARAIRLAAAGTPSAASQQQRDLGSIRQFITGMGLVTLFDAPWSAVYLLVTFSISPPLGWLTLGGCILLVVLGALTELTTKKPLDQAQRAGMQTLGVVDASSRHAETIEAMGMTGAMVRHWRQGFDTAQGCQKLAGNRSALLQAITKVVRMSLQIGITGIGAYLVLERQLTSGGMIAASILAARAFAPFENAIAFWKMGVTARAAYRRLDEAVAVKIAPRGDMELPAPKGALAAERVIFQPMPGKKPVLHNISFSLQPGESLGIIGPSGAGKTTLARLLTGIAAPSAGHIRLDGNDLATWGREDVGRYIGYLPQQADLFAGRICDNIARMQHDAPAQAVLDAAEMAGVHGLIQRLPMGYDTQWSPHQPSLSPGQKQRIALARAVYGDPRLVVLDEPNLNLDGEGETALVDMLHRLKLRGATVVMVAHKPSLIQCMDYVMVLKEGAIEQAGPREQVLQAYTRLAAGKAQP